MQRYLGKRKTLRIYISNEDVHEGRPLFEALLALAKEQGMAGATVFKAAAGIGAHSEVHTFSVWVLKQKVPLVVEIIESEEKIRAFLAAAEGMIEEGLVTMSDVEVVQYRHPRFGES
jgi:PII-like signaling protein